MAEFKLVLADPKTGKCVQHEVKAEVASHFLGKKIGDTIRGEIFDKTGYEFEIAGGSDHAGFPMRRDLEGTGRKKILAIGGVGMKKKEKGIRQKKTLCGNTIHEKTAQINLKVLKAGSAPLFEEKKEEAAEENKSGAAEEKK